MREVERWDADLRVVLVLVAVLLLVQVLGVLLGLVLGLLAVEEVQALGLEELVDLGGGYAGEGLLGEAVRDGLAVLALALLPEVHGLEGGAAGYGLVGPAGLMGLTVVDLLALGLGVVYVGGDKSLVSGRKDVGRRKGGLE